jgi:hypothetical protein
MEKEFLVSKSELNKEGYVIISSYFLDYCVEILGSGPGMLYIQLLNYCHKGKDIAWPTLVTLGRKMQFTPKSITKFHQVLLKHGLIKKVIKGKTPSGNYNRNIYQVTPIHRVKNTLTTGKIFPKVEEKITPDIGKKLPTNNTNPNNINLTAANRENAAADFKKLKEKGEEKMGAVRERMLELGLKEKFVGQLLKEYPVKKIDEKLDLLMDKRNIQNPAGWLRTALKNDYRGEEEESRGRKKRMDSRFRGNDIKGNGNDNSQTPSPLEGEGQGEGDKILSTEEVRRRFHFLRDKLMAMGSP